MTPSYGVFAQYYDALTENVAYAARAEALCRLIATWEQPDMPDRILPALACRTGALQGESARCG